MLKDYTDIYNRLVTLYCKTKDPSIEKKAREKIYELVYRQMAISYYSYLMKNKLFRRDNEDGVNECSIRLLERIEKHKAQGKPYTTKRFHTVLYWEVLYFMRKGSTQFNDNLESYDEYQENLLKQEEMLNDDENISFFDEEKMD